MRPRAEFWASISRVATYESLVNCASATVDPRARRQAVQSPGRRAARRTRRADRKLTARPPFQPIFGCRLLPWRREGAVTTGKGRSREPAVSRDRPSKRQIAKQERERAEQVAQQQRHQFESLAIKAAHGDAKALQALPAAAAHVRESYSDDNGGRLGNLGARPACLRPGTNSA